MFRVQLCRGNSKQNFMLHLLCECWLAVQEISANGPKLKKFMLCIFKAFCMTNKNRPYGRGYGSFGRAVESHIGGPQFESSNFLYRTFIYCQSHWKIGPSKWTLYIANAQIQSFFIWSGPGCNKNVFGTQTWLSCAKTISISCGTLGTFQRNGDANSLGQSLHNLSLTYFIRRADITFLT